MSFIFKEVSTKDFMNNKIIIVILITSGISCGDTLTAKPVIAQTPTSEIATQIISLENIHFNFSAKKDPENKGFINVHAMLSNKNPDTVYLYTWTDHGKQHSLQYDTAKFQYFQERVSNATYPVIEIIPPRAQINFDATFLQKQPTDKIKLDFDFFRIEKPRDFDIRNMDINKVAKFQQQRKRTILEGRERPIK